MCFCVQKSSATPLSKDQCSQTNFTGISFTSCITKLRKVIKQLRNQLASKCRSFDLLKKKHDICSEELQKRPPLSQQLSKEQQEFINAQCQAASRPKKGMRWTPSQKRSAVLLYMKSPSAYRTLSSKLRLPHKDTLLKSVRPVFANVSS
jgi:hypothetical protein